MRWALRTSCGRRHLGLDAHCDRPGFPARIPGLADGPHSASAARSFKLPARFAPVVLPLLLSILMTCIVSLISTLVGDGLAMGTWLRSWAVSWPIAFPTLLLVLPAVRRATTAIVHTN